MSGWIKIHRSLLEWEWYGDTNTFRLFLHLLLKANHKDKRYQGKVIKRGSLLTGLQLLSNETHLTIRQVRTAINKLKTTNEVTIKTSPQGTEIEILNYDKYQEATNERQTSDKQNDKQNDKRNDKQTTNKRQTKQAHKELKNKHLTNTKPNERQTNDKQTTNETTNKATNKATTNKNIKNIKNNPPIPPFTEFLEFAKKLEPRIDEDDLRMRYETWKDDGWCVTRKGELNEIKNWKLTLRNTIPYLKKNEIIDLAKWRPV